VFAPFISEIRPFAYSLLPLDPARHTMRRQRRPYDIQNSLDPLPRVYYEVFSNYEDSIIDGNVLPASHGISVDQFLTLDEVKNTISCYACGGCGFIVYKTAGWIRKPICVNGWKGYSENGWLTF